MYLFHFQVSSYRPFSSCLCLWLVSSQQFGRVPSARGTALIHWPQWLPLINPHHQILLREKCGFPPCSNHQPRVEEGDESREPRISCRFSFPNIHGKVFPSSCRRDRPCCIARKQYGTGHRYGARSPDRTVGGPLHLVSYHSPRRIEEYLGGLLVWDREPFCCE